MGTIIAKTDLPTALRSNEQIDLMVAGANAQASRVAPCLAAADPAPSDDQLAEAKLVLAGAIARWAEAGSGALQQQTAGPFQMQVDTRQKSSGYRLWPTEINQLQEICSDPTKSGRVYAVDTMSTAALHADICALELGAGYCSCGADFAGFPLYEYSEDAF